MNVLKFFLCFFVFLIAFNADGFCAEYKSTIDYIEKTNKLWGIAGCTINDDGTITFVDRQKSGVGEGQFLWIDDETNSFPDRITLKQGESFDLIDGHHAFITYTYLGLENNRISINVTDKFDARSFGDGIKVNKKDVIIFPYKDQ
jgi:hypothetical protein